MFVAPDQLDILTDKNIQGTPALVIEILSPSTGSFPQAAGLTAKGLDTLDTPLLAGWSLGLARLFR